MSRLSALILLFVWLAAAPMLQAVPLDVEADQIERFGDRIEARGNVIVTGENLELRCNYLIYDSASFDIWATGNCFLQETTATSRAAVIYLNTRRNDLYLEDGMIIDTAQPIQISGRSIRRYGYDIYQGEDVSYTTCLAELPDWSIRASQIDIPIDGYASVKHARLQVFDKPLLYFPYIYYPAKLERQSGVLFPELGSSSDTGYQIGLPFYFTIGPSYDLTVTPHLLRSRGLLLGNQFRYQPAYNVSGELYIEALHDKKGGERMEAGILPLIADDRWFMRFNHKQDDLNIDLNLVSHEDYFRDIGTMYNGEDDSYGSDLKELKSRLEWNSAYRGISYNLSAQWKQDLMVRGDDTTLQELPRFKARMAQRQLPNTPFKVTADLDSMYFYTQEWLRGTKNRASAEISYPINIFPYLTLKPYLKGSYRDTRLDNNDAGWKHYQHVEQDWIYEGRPYAMDSYSEHWQTRGVTAMTTLYSQRFLNDLYHQLVPSVSFSYNSRLGSNYDVNDPMYNRDLYPQLFSGEDWSKSNLATFSIANYIRNDQGRALAEADLSRSFNHITDRWDLAKLTLKFNPASWISMEHTNSFGRAHREYAIPGTTLDTYSLKRPYATQENKTTLRFKDGRGDSLSLTSEFNRDDANSLTIGGAVNLGSGFDLRLDAKHDYIKQRDEFWILGLRYKRQCDSIDLFVEVEPRDSYYHDLDIDNAIIGSVVTGGSLNPADINPRPVIPRNVTLNLTINLLGIGDVIKTKYGFEDKDS